MAARGAGAAGGRMRHVGLLVGQTIIISYPSLELLLGGHLSRVQAAGVLSLEDVERWWTHLREAHEAGTFFYDFTALIVAGTKS